MKNNFNKIDIKCTSNNTILHASNFEKKNIIVSTGTVGFKGGKRSTPYAAQQAGETMGTKLLENFIKEVIICFTGIGKNRKSIVKGLRKKNITIVKIVDKTQVPHNGCRPTKKRKL